MALRSTFRNFHQSFKNIFRSTFASDSSVPTSEKTIHSILTSRFTNDSLIEVEDMSGGCGAMFKIYVESPDFKNMKTLQQHRIIKDALREEIKDIHGLTIMTKVKE